MKESILGLAWRGYPRRGFFFSPTGVVIVLILTIIVVLKFVKLNYP